MPTASLCLWLFHRWCCKRQIISQSQPSARFFLPSFWYKLILFSYVWRMLPQSCFGFYRYFSAKSNLAFLLLRLMNGLHLLVNPLNVLLWGFLLTVDLCNAYPLKSVLHFNVLKGLFFTVESILCLSVSIVFCGRLGLFMFLSSSVHIFFQNIPNCWFDHLICLVLAL